MRLLPRLLVLCSLVVASAAPAVAQSGTAAPTDTPEAAVRRLLSAVADSNLVALADAWGTPSGPASKVKPQEWQRRVAVIQAYMRLGNYRLLGVDQTARTEGPRRTILVEMKRDNCIKQIPIQTARLKDGRWLVTAVDLEAVGVPGKRCEGD